MLKRLANINKANDLHNLRDIKTNIYARDIDYYRLNKDKFDMRRFYEAYIKLESLEEKLFMKNDALEEFKTVKNNVKSEHLKDIVKELERAIFGYDYDEELKYEESIAERTKMRRQNKETDKKDV